MMQKLMIALIAISLVSARILANNIVSVTVQSGVCVNTSGCRIDNQQSTVIGSDGNALGGAAPAAPGDSDQNGNGEPEEAS